MAKPSRQAIIASLLGRHGRTFAQELGIKIQGNTPSPLFRLLCAALLFSTRISADLAEQAARALANEGWTTPQKMAAATWEERTRVLNRSGYARYDESTSRMLGETAQLLLDRYRGDLRKLREEAGRVPTQERRLLREFKGIGEVGVDIFFREAQAVWKELFPFADRKALQGAKELDLPTEAEQLSSLVAPRDFPRLVAALVRMQLSHTNQEIVAAAGS